MNTITHWWKTADTIAAGEYLGDVVDGILVPAVAVTAVETPAGTNGLRRITTSAGTFVVQSTAEFYVFEARK